MAKMDDDFGKALAQKNFEKAWDIANHFWYGAPRKQRAVIYEQNQAILELLKK